MSNLQPACKICDEGILISKKIHRLSGPAVAIGYIFLIPSILGLAASAVLAVLLLSQPFGIYLGAPDFITATMIVVAATSFVSGLFGWLLVMKKKVLECSACGATISAS